MFMVAPTGIMNLDTRGFTFKLSSAVFNERGITAAELEVEKARSCTFFIAFMNCNGFWLVNK